MQNHPFTMGRRRTLRRLLVGSVMGLAPFPVLVKTASAMGRPDGGHIPTPPGAQNRCLQTRSSYPLIELGCEFIFSSKNKYVFDVIIKLI